MIRYIIRRLLQTVLVLFLVMTLVFVILRVVGDPAKMMVTPDSSYEDLQNIRRILGLDQPIWKQYLNYLSDVLRGDFGSSYYFERPVIDKIGAQIEEALIINERIDKKTASEKTVELLRMVGVPDPARCANSYPHQLSGGMRQRAMIAMAFSCEPKLLLADEPTTALDVTIQAQILDLIQTLKEQHGMTVVFVTHDLGIVADIAQRVIVMYAGRVVEDASCSELFRNPLHPYTRGLLNCIPRIDDDREELDTIEGQVPTPANFPTGCRFHPRCPKAMEICKCIAPQSVDVGNHVVACHLYAEESNNSVE